jgi:hypothetical protein
MTKAEFDNLTKCGFSYLWLGHGQGVIHSWTCLIAISDGIQIYRDVTRKSQGSFYSQIRKLNRQFRKCEILN